MHGARLAVAEFNFLMHGARLAVAEFNFSDMRCGMSGGGILYPVVLTCGSLSQPTW
jgi:hypothetical protein